MKAKLKKCTLVMHYQVCTFADKTGTVNGLIFQSHQALTFTAHGKEQHELPLIQTIEKFSHISELKQTVQRLKKFSCIF